MKKMFYLLGCLLAGALLLVGCDKDDDKSSPMVALYATEYEATVDRVHVEDDINFTVTVNPDGTKHLTMYDFELSAERLLEGAATIEKEMEEEKMANLKFVDNVVKVVFSSSSHTVLASDKESFVMFTIKGEGLVEVSYEVTFADKENFNTISRTVVCERLYAK